MTYGDDMPEVCKRYGCGRKPQPQHGQGFQLAFMVAWLLVAFSAVGMMAWGVMYTVLGWMR